MSTLPEQFSAARQSHIDAQLAFFQNFTTSAVANVEKIIALNLSTTRASMEKSAAAMQQLLTVKDPRDLFSLTTHSQQNFDNMLAYGRQLFGIGSVAPVAAVAPVKLAVVSKTAAPVIAPEAAPEAPAPQTPEPVAAVTAPVSAPEKPALARIQEAPAAKVKPAAKAIEKVVAKSAPAEVIDKVVGKSAPAKPAAASFPSVARPVAVSTLAAVEAPKPPAPAPGKPKAKTASEPKQLDMLTPKGKTRK